MKTNRRPPPPRNRAYKRRRLRKKKLIKKLENIRKYREAKEKYLTKFPNNNKKAKILEKEASAPLSPEPNAHAIMPSFCSPKPLKEMDLVDL
ncbi:9380_t:CDS:2, partial [Funneliformis geosporum]